MSEPGGKWVPEGGWEKVGDWTDDYDEHPDLGVDDSDEPGSAMRKCQNCAEAEHDICWDTNPDRDCPCCLDTWFGGIFASGNRPGGL